MTDSQPGRERAETVQSLRTGAVIAVVFLLAYLLLNLHGTRGIQEESLIDNVAALLVAILFLGFTFTAPLPRYRNAATLVFCIILVTLFVRISATASDAQPRFMAAILCPLAAALLAGWGPAWQLTLNAACLVSYAAAEFMLPLADPKEPYRWLWLLLALVVAQAATVLSDRRARSLSAERVGLRNEMESRERQAEMIAHDIRSPLAALSGFLSLMQDSDVGEQEKIKTLSRMRSIARRMELLVDNLVELRRFNTGTPEPPGRTANPDAVAADIARVWAEEARINGATILTEFGCGVSPEADRACMERIFANLLANAVARAGTGEIRFRTRLRDTRLEIEVSDNGPEAGASEISRMFERPGSYESKVGAIRLGMYVARTLVESRGGKIEAHRCAGRGLRIRAELPIGPIREQH